jgi:hypothetical protein
MGRYHAFSIASALTLALGMSSCSSASGPKEGTFRGVYLTAFEVSSFRPCGGAQYWWLRDASGTLGSQLPPNTPPGYEISAYLQVRGRRSKAGTYGHMAAYRYEIVVQEVLEVTADTTGKCQ